MNPRITPLILAVLLAFPCGAQVPPAARTEPGPDGPDGSEEDSGIFPLSLVLEAVQGDVGRWRPDWPPEIPPDAFTVPGAARIDLDLEGGGTGARVLGRYCLARDSQGRPTDFPLALAATAPDPAPALAQVSLRYDAEGGITAIDIEIPVPAPETAPETVTDGTALEITRGAAPESAPLPGTGAPSAADTPERLVVSLSIRFDSPYFPWAQVPPGLRVEYGERRYHVLFSAGIHEIAETWFDPRGTFSAYFKSRIGPASEGEPFWRILGVEGAEYQREESGVWRPFKPLSGSFYYESGGNLSERSGEYGSCSAVYGGAGRPLYWSRTYGILEARNFSLQWDQGGRLVRRRDLTGGAGDSPVDFRYDYEFDSRGNWTRMRETALFRAGNLLLPAYGRDIVRRVVYAEGEGDGGLD